MVVHVCLFTICLLPVVKWVKFKRNTDTAHAVSCTQLE